MVSLLLAIAFASPDIKQIRCSPYASTSGPGFSARGPMDVDGRTAALTISIDGAPEFQETYELVAVHDRGLYITYFLENPTSQAPSLAIRVANSQLSPNSNLYLHSTETFTAICDFAQ